MGCGCSRSIPKPPEATLPRSRPTVAHGESPDTGRIESKQGSAENHAFRECFSVLTDGITDPGRLAIELYSKGLIGPDLRTEAQKQGIEERVKIERLLSAIEAQIESSPNIKFQEFLDVLQNEPSLQHLATRLENTHHNIVTMPQTTPTPSSLPIGTYASYLKSVYTQKKLPNYDKWPKVKSKEYINLALIEKEDITKTEVVQFKRATMHGNIDDIKKSKRATNISQVAQLPDGSQPKCILVEGAPGVGKSTFAWKLCRKWGKGKLLQQYRLVVLLRLRDKSVRAAKNISNLFQYHDHQIQQAAVEEIKKLRGKGVLLLFEGYDELPQEMRIESSVFLDVIMGRELPEATVLITSRPWASEFLYDKCNNHISQHIEILGFTKGNIQSYLESTTANDPSLLEGLKKYISCYPHIGGLMYIPLNSAIVVEVYRNSRKDETTVIPKTMTELYSSLVRSLLLCYLYDHPVHSKKRRWRVRSFDDLPKDVYQQLCELGRIAYEGIIHEQQVIFSDLPEDFETLGLMQCTPELYVDEGAVVSYNFLHLTVQEYLAAFYLAQQPVEKQIEHCREFKAVQGEAEYYRKQWDHLQMMLRFLSGLGRFQGYSDEVLSTLCIDIKEFGGEVQHEIIVDVLHWLFEAQDDDVFATLLGSSDIQLRVQFVTTPFDCFVLGYCVSHSNRTWNIDIENEGMEMFVRGVMEKETHCTGGIAELGLTHDNISEGLRHLLSLPKQLINTLKQFGLQHNKLGSAACADLANLMPHMPYLEVFGLFDEQINDIESLSSHETKIGVEDCRALCELLSSSTSLKNLSIDDSALSPEVFELIINGLHHNTTLEKLVMICPHFPEQIIISLASMLRTNHTLVHLELGTCNIDSDGALQLASAMSLNNTLQRLQLGHTPIGIEEAAAFAEILRTNHILAELNLEEHGSHYGTCQLAGFLCTSQNFYMSGNQIQAMAGAAETLLKNKSLKRLKLCYYDSIASALCTNNTLQSLWLWDNSVGVEGATALAKMLHENKSLKELHFQGNDSIGEEGAKKLIDSLKQNATLGLLVLPKDYESSFTRSELDNRVFFSDQIPFW